MSIRLDWSAVLTGAPATWLLGGISVTLAVTVIASALAAVTAVALSSMRLLPFAPLRAFAAAFVAVFRNTPLLVQLLVWYFVVFGILPQGFREWAFADHPWSVLPGNVSLFSPEFLASAWGLGIFGGVFLSEEIRAGLNAVSSGQREAARAQGLGEGTILLSILLPQALTNAYEPIVGQFLNVMKLSSIACSVGLAEITYQSRAIESFNSRAFEAFALGTLLYLAIGFALERSLMSVRRRKNAH